MTCLTNFPGRSSRRGDACRRHAHGVLPLLAALGLLTVSAARAETLTLEQCLRETALHDPQVIEQQREIERAAGTKLTLRSRALPTLAISGILGQRGDQGSTTLIIPIPGRDANGNKYPDFQFVQKRPSQFLAIGSGAFYQPIFDVAIPAAWRRGRIEVETARENYYATAVGKLYQTRLLFNQVIYHRENLALLNEIQRTISSNAGAVEGLVKAGLVARQQLLQAQLQSAGFAPQISTTTGSYRTALTALFALMGREQSATGSGDLVAHVELQGELDEAALPIDTRAAAEKALAYRPDMDALRSLSRGLREDAKIARAGYFPIVKIYVTGDLIPQSFTQSNRPNALREGDTVQTTEARPGARYDWNVIDTGAVAGAAQSLDHLREQIDISLHAMEQSVPRDLARLRATLQKDAATLESLQANLSAAQDTLNIVTATIAQGTGSQLDFNNAQSGLLNVRSSLLQARFDASNARAEFDLVTGRYLRFISDAPEDRHASKTRALK